MTGKNNNWLTKSDDGRWQDVTEKKYAYDIIAPNFANKRTSWIER
jgi:hypothetical protein